jgi:hypothetical protein
MRQTMLVPVTFAVAALLAFQPCVAAPPAVAPASAPATAPAPADVMLLGMFHFANPGQDIVKTRVIDVMAPPNQAWLDGFAARLAAFKPTDVLVECNPSEQEAYQQQFKDYAAGKFALPANENYQIGFRVAKQAGLSRVTCFDEDKIGWDAEPMFDYMAKHEPELKAQLEATFQSIGAQMDKEQATLPLGQLLALTNDPARDALNKSIYLRTNAVDAGGSFVGADAASSWWHRNFRMYANVQKAAAPGHRVLVLAGQGHTAILKDLLANDDQRHARDARPYLNASPAVP